jgi:HK97 family phage prohead protease
MSDQNITLEAIGEFPFTFHIEKAVAIDEDSELLLEGIASTTNIDHDKERMSKDALRNMESAINKDGVPLRVEHQKEGSAVIGRVYKAWVDDRNQLHVRAKLDKSHPVSSILHSSMKQGVKMGLSVGGLVKRATKEFSEALGGVVKTFYDVILQEVSVTPRPANYDAWLIAKSVAKNEEDAKGYDNNIDFRNLFLQAYPQLDYLQSFAKSVPDKAWRKVESPEINKEQNNNKMSKDLEKKEGETETETTKAVSREEFSTLSKAFKDLAGLVSKGFESVGALISKAMDGSAKDSANPDKDKPKDESPTAKATDSTPKDQANPDKAKEKDPTQQTAKATDTTETDDKTKKATDTETEETKKAKEKTDTYDIETVNRSIQSLNKAMENFGKEKTDTETDETKKAKEDTDTKTETEKAKTDETTETETKKTIHPLDEFVVKITKAMEAVMERMEKGGKRVLGFEKSFIEDIQNSKEAQAELQKLLKLPGFKKSMVMGVPYMITKEGKRYPLINLPQEKVEKSDTKGKNFKDLYKTKYSSVSNETQE